jgi:hypothetical protein
MQIDIFNNPSPWQYYVYASLIIAALIFFGHTVLRHRRRTLRILALPVHLVLGSVLFVLSKLGGKKQSDSDGDIEQQGKDTPSKLPRY